jgi:hypothetical protein
MYRLVQAAAGTALPHATAAPGLTVRCAPDGFDLHSLPADSYKGSGAIAGGLYHKQAMKEWQQKQHLHTPNVAREFEVGERVYALNPKYCDGTRLRAGPMHDAPFNGVNASNDTVVDVVRLEGRFALVRKLDANEGWIQLRNLTRIKRTPGM